MFFFSGGRGGGRKRGGRKKGRKISQTWEVLWLIWTLGANMNNENLLQFIRQSKYVYAKSKNHISKKKSQKKWESIIERGIGWCVFVYFFFFFVLANTWGTMSYTSFAKIIFELVKAQCSAFYCRESWFKHFLDVFLQFFILRLEKRKDEKKKTIVLHVRK